MVLISHDIALLTLNMRLGKRLVLGERLLVIAHTVTFEIRLCRKIDSVFVAEVIPTGIIRIVTSTYSIDIQLFHYLNILNHTLYRDDIATIRIKLMTVRSLNQDRLSVNQQLSSFYLNMTEANLLFDNFLDILTFL